MRIVLLNPPSPFLINQKAFVPLGLLYLAAQARQAGHEVLVRDLAGRENDLPEALSDLQADLFGITASTPQYPWAKRLLAEIRRISPGTPVVIGGSHASSLPERCIEDGFDTAVAGEGEMALLEIADKGTRGLVREPYIKIIDAIPMPARDIIDIRGYGYSVEGGLATTLITSRGCPFQCSFCSKDVWNRGVRFHGVARIVAELAECIERYGFRHFLFLDDSLTLHRKRLFELCRVIEPMKIQWRGYARSGNTDREMLEAMKRAGCVELGVGVESGSQKILDAVCKATKVEDNSRLVRECREVGIVSNVFILIGLPGESRETVAETRRWMELNRPDKFGYNIFAPYIGTPINGHPENYDIHLYPMPDEQSWVKGRQGEYHSFVSTSNLSREEILQLFQENFAYFQDLLNWRPGIGREKEKSA